eukprot:TRINITY_DN72305_c0_g1_i1.p1 TRINITY_DN72305_c0_g1~~TRINITY_DN72305_c0_g1_i1.p1  ORF type:complete len:264 (-),score=48.41 TRINITY_DN72305_c0_g1_i1:114-905(-)
MAYHKSMETPMDKPDAIVTGLAPFAGSDSMKLDNDPRFFQGNVIDKRLGAFAGLGVVSGLMMDSAMGEIMDADKNFNWHTANGWLHFVGFMLMTFVLWANTLSTYTAVVQTYHSTRLMTSGANGFEMAASYYLNKNITFWRHTSIKVMLVSLPILLGSMALKLLVKFNVDQQSEAPTWISFTESGGDKVAPGHPNWKGVTLSGFLCCMAYVLAGIWLLCIHKRHQDVFREKYTALGHSMPFLQSHTGSLMTFAGHPGSLAPDV